MQFYLITLSNIRLLDYGKDGFFGVYSLHFYTALAAFAFIPLCNILPHYGDVEIKTQVPLMNFQK